MEKEISNLGSLYLRFGFGSLNLLPSAAREDLSDADWARHQSTRVLRQWLMIPYGDKLQWR